jgi:hypothetical protein
MRCRRSASKIARHGSGSVGITQQYWDVSRNVLFLIGIFVAIGRQRNSLPSPLGGSLARNLLSCCRRLLIGLRFLSTNWQEFGAMKFWLFAI